MARRLLRAPAAADGQWAPRGTVLITGGTGAIGGHVARWLARGGARRVVLASRSGPAATGAAALTAALAVGGTQVSVVACDTAQRDGVAGLLAGIAADGPPLTAVMHAAGTGQATALQDTTTAELTAVMSAKAAGARWLDELTADLSLDAFVLFSSASATWGSGRQPAYAAANAYLDGLAENRQARGLPATSVGWGLWGGGGLADGETTTQLQRRGLRVMDPDLAIRALDQALVGADGLLTVADVDWARFAPAYTLARPSPLIASLPEVRQVLAADAAGLDAGAPAARTALERRLANVPPADRGRILLELIRAEAAAVLGLPGTGKVGPQRPFRDLGFDSLTALELRNQLAEATGLRLPATLVFDYPTPAVLADYLRADIFPGEAAGQPPVFAELDQLESVLSGISADSDIRADVTVRLQTVLSRWVSAQEAPKTAAVTGKLRSATADEVLSFIEKEFGVS
jgi:NAD(P)-dependent dehydrogenase (short-subunit alcohol dehydrogenase family)/acyl carrier protein